MAKLDGQSTSGTAGLTRYLSRANAWALVLGCSIGWGAFVMPATTLLPKAGPLGTIIGMVLSAAVMMIISVSLNYMLNRYSDSGGAYEFTKRTLGHDHAFLCAWSLVLAYISILWANATAFILISRFLFGSVFQFGFHYVVAGYDVYFGEVIATLVVLMAFGLFACMKKRLVNWVNTVLAFILFFGVVACFFIVIGHQGFESLSFDPAFGIDTTPAVGVMGIVALAPWAFLGFESIAQAAGECAFPSKQMLPILIIGVACGAIIYILMTMVSVMGTPAEYGSWAAYIADLGNLSGLDGLPTFHAMQLVMGRAGVAILAVVVVAAMSTSLIGLYRTLGRIAYTAAQDEVLPAWFGKLNKDGVPRNAILAIMLISVFIPFVGRAAIGWIVDVTSVSASIVYGYASLCSVMLARKEGNTKIVVCGAIGVVFSVIFLVYPLVPNAWSVSALAPESYLILAAWSIVGLLLFRLTFQRDTKNRYGKSTVVWILLIFLILFASTMWMRQVTHDNMEGIVTKVSEYYAEDYAEHGIILSDEEIVLEEEHIAQQISDMRSALLNNSLVQTALIMLSLAIMFSIYALMRKREREHDVQRAAAEETSKAKTAFLSNMSHDIRTPMNAIIGYTHLARRDGVSPEETKEYLEKIDSSSKHLLALINDVLEMSRIESGKMELELAECDLRKLIVDVRDMFATQMQEKGITYVAESDDVRDRFVMCDENRLNRVLLNLISNAYKFTPEGGSVTVSLAQVGDAKNGRASYELHVRDTGIGMTEEFASKVFEEFERERNTTVSGIQGTGLGMAITKNIIDLMGGTIDVVTALGEGTEFIVRLDFEIVERDDDSAADLHEGAGQADEVDFEGKRILLVEDNEINQEIAVLVLEEIGFIVETADNGKIALDMVSASEPGYYDAVLMDVQMPVMNGYEATAAIRALDNPALSSIPIVAASANAFAEDVAAARDAGMDAHVAKPIDVGRVIDVLSSLLANRQK